MGQSLRNRADLKNRIAVYFGSRAVFELAGSENPVAALICQSDHHADIGLVKVVSKERFCAIGFGVGEMILRRSREPGRQQQCSKAVESGGHCNVHTESIG